MEGILRVEKVWGKIWGMEWDVIEVNFYILLVWFIKVVIFNRYSF